MHTKQAPVEYVLYWVHLKKKAQGAGTGSFQGRRFRADIKFRPVSLENELLQHRLTTMASQEIRQRSLKERNTQLRKRTETVELKVAKIAELCDLDTALVMRKRESGEIYSFRSSDSFRPNMEDIVSPYNVYVVPPSNNCQLAHPKSRNKLPKDIEKIKRKKERQRLRGVRRRAELLSEGRASNERGSHGWVKKAASFLPEPPSFDGTILRRRA